MVLPRTRMDEKRPAVGAPIETTATIVLLPLLPLEVIIVMIETGIGIAIEIEIGNILPQAAVELVEKKTERKGTATETEIGSGKERKIERERDIGRAVI